MERTAVNQRARQVKAAFQRCIDKIRVVVVANKFLDLSVQELEMFETLFNGSFRRNLEDYRNILDGLEAVQLDFHEIDFDDVLKGYRMPAGSAEKQTARVETEGFGDPSSAHHVSDPNPPGTSSGVMVDSSAGDDVAAASTAAAKRKTLSQQRTRFSDAVKRLAQCGLASAKDVGQGVQIDPKKLEIIAELENLNKIFSDQLERDPIEEAESKEKARIAAERNRHHEEALRAAQDAEKDLLAQTEQQRSAKLQELNKLEKHISLLNMLSAEKLEEKRSLLAEEMDEKVQAAEARVADLKKDQDIAKTHLEAQRAQQKREEVELIRIKRTMESDLEAFTKKYDQEMWSKQNELESLTDDLQQQSEQLEKVKESLVAISSEYFRIIEERRLEAERRVQAIRDMEIQIKAVTTIQAIWRGYLIRKWFKRKRAKKTKRGRGGGGGGGGPGSIRVRPGTAATSSGGGGTDDQPTQLQAPTTAIEKSKMKAGVTRRKSVRGR